MVVEMGGGIRGVDAGTWLAVREPEVTMWTG